MAIVVVMVVPMAGHCKPANVVQVAAADAATSAPRQVDARNMRPEALDALLAPVLMPRSRCARCVSRARRRTKFLYDILVLHVCSLSWDDLRR